MIWLSVALGHISSHPVCLGHGAAWPALSISGFLIHVLLRNPRLTPRKHCLLCKYIRTLPNPAT